MINANITAISSIETYSIMLLFRIRRPSLVPVPTLLVGISSDMCGKDGCSYIFVASKSNDFDNLGYKKEKEPNEKEHI